jgi:ankyrin repeat protein
MTWCDVGECAVQTQGLTPLHYASRGGNVECVKLLLDKGVGLDVPDVSWLLVQVGMGQGAVRQHGWVTV